MTIYIISLLLIIICISFFVIHRKDNKEIYDLKDTIEKQKDVIIKVKKYEQEFDNSSDSDIDEFLHK